MNHEDFLRALAVFNNRRPFKSFKIELSSGDRFAVVHPEALRRSGNLFVHVSTDHTNRLFDAASVSHFLVEPKVKS